MFVDGRYLYEVKPLFPEIRVFDISHPASPSFVRSIPSPSGFGMVDVTVRNGRLYTTDFHNNGRVSIFDVSHVGDLSIPVPLLGNILSTGGCTHDSVPTEDGQFVIVNHVCPGYGVEIYDISNPAKPKLASNIVIRVTDATSGSQPMVVGNLLYLASLEAGLLVYNTADPYHPVRVANYDTYTGPYGEPGECARLSSHTAGPFSDFDPCPTGCGAWGVYPFLGNDRILVSDFDGGLFVLSLDNPPAAAATVNSAAISSTLPIVLLPEPLPELGNPSYGFGSVDPSAGVDVLKVPDKARENNQASHGTVAGQASERTPAEAGRRQGANAGWVDQALIDFDAAVSALDDALLANLASALVG